MTIKLFQEIEDDSLKEYSGDSNYEMYKGIVLDKKDNVFRVVSGMFRDKKEFYEKMKKRGLVTRKVFEKKVFDWIEENAKNNLEAYLMFSTAFSKWKQNNMLTDYYVKLLNDIPQLNREGQKGNPNSRGASDKAGFGEALLTEEEYYKDIYVDLEGSRPANIKITPLDNNTGQPLTDKTFSTTANIWDVESTDIYSVPAFVDGKPNPVWNKKIKRRYDDPAFYRTIFEEFSEMGDLQGYDLVLFQEDDKPPFLLSKAKLLTHYSAKNLTPSYEWGPLHKPAANALVDVHINNAENSTEYESDRMKKLITATIQNTKPNLTKKEHRLIKQKREQLRMLITTKLPYVAASDPDGPEKRREYVAARDRKLERIRAEIQQILNVGKARVVNNNYLNQKSADRYRAAKKTERDVGVADTVEYNNLGISHGNTKYNGNAHEEFLTRLQNKWQNEEKLERIKKAQSQNNTVRLKKPVKKDVLQDWDNMDYSDRKLAQEAAVNSGVNTMYNTQPIGGQPMDVFPTNRGMLPVGGLFVEDQVEEANAHSKLNEKLFADGILKTDIRDALLKIAKQFEEYLDIPFEVEDIYFTGSSANYNYNEGSDIDLHLVYDIEKVGIAAEILTKYLNSAKKVFNDKYKLSVKGIPVELGCEILSEPLVTSAIYSVLEDAWIKKPENSEIEMADVDPVEYTNMSNKIENAISSNTSTTIEKVWKELGLMRKQSLADEGEFGKGNALFKKLRNLGFLNRLKDAYYATTSQELSLESIEE